MKWVLVVLSLLVLAGCQQVVTEEKPMSVNKIATVETNKGTFTIMLDVEKAPITAGNFIKLAEQGFYDGTVFHRVIANFMIQGGDPNGDGTGGPGYTIQDEFHPDLSNMPGTISMANRGPNTGGSQFFINVADNSFLDFNKPPASSKHAVFGHVVEGMEIIDQIATVETNSRDRPLEEVQIVSVTISDAEN